MSELKRVDKAGKYTGRITDKGISKSRNGFYQFVADIVVTKELVPNEGYHELAEERSIRAYIMLSGRNGRNEVQQDAIEKAFGVKLSDGINVIQDLDVEGREFNFVISQEDAWEDDPDDAEPRFRVDWINKAGGVREMNSKEVEECSNDWSDLFSGAGVGIGEADDSEVPF